MNGENARDLWDQHRRTVNRNMNITQWNNILLEFLLLFLRWKASRALGNTIEELEYTRPRGRSDRLRETMLEL